MDLRCLFVGLEDAGEVLVPSSRSSSSMTFFRRVLKHVPIYFVFVVFVVVHSFLLFCLFFFDNIRKRNEILFSPFQSPKLFFRTAAFFFGGRQNRFAIWRRCFALSQLNKEKLLL